MAISIPPRLPFFWQPLVFFSIGLLGLSLVEILTRSFYALHDSRTPVEVSILQFMFVIGLSIIFLCSSGSKRPGSGNFDRLSG